MPNLLSAASALVGLASGPGGIVNTPASRRPITFDKTPAAQIINANQALQFINDQSVQQERLISDANALLNQVDLSGELQRIKERNQKIFGMNEGGVNGFYEVDLVNPASAVIENADETDGFRLYLIRPEPPPVAQYAKLIGRSGNAIAGAIGSATETIGESLDGVPVLDGIADNAVEGGKKLQEIGPAIEKWMTEAGQNWDESFKKYLEKAYNEHSKGNAFYSVVLPMPSNLVDSHQHETDDLALGALLPIANAIGVGANNFSNSFSTRVYDTRAAKRTGVLPGRVGEFINGVSEIGSAFLAEAAALTVNNARARIGIGINPNTETVYGAPVPRQFQFNFDLKPKTKKEVQLVQDFIAKIKQHSYPISFFGIAGQNQLYAYPGEVYFEFSGKYRGKLFRSLRPCIIKNIQVSYGSDQQYSHFRDGNPTTFNVAITLIETRRLDRNILFDDQQASQSSLAEGSYRDSVKFRDTLAGALINDTLRNPNEAVDNVLQTLNPINYFNNQ